MKPLERTARTTLVVELNPGAPLLIAQAARTSRTSRRQAKRRKPLHDLCDTSHMSQSSDPDTAAAGAGLAPVACLSASAYLDPPRWRGPETRDNRPEGQVSSCGRVTDRTQEGSQKSSQIFHGLDISFRFVLRSDARLYTHVHMYAHSLDLQCAPC